MAPRNMVTGWQKTLIGMGHFKGTADGKCDDRIIEAFAACAKAKCRM